MNNDVTRPKIALERDRLIALSGLAGVSALAWVYLFSLSQSMTGMEPAMPHAQAWVSLDIASAFVMWAVMMVAMMLPSAIPVVLMFVAIKRGHGEPHSFAPAAMFLMGYLMVWMGFSALATLAQWGLQAVAALSPGIVSVSPLAGGALLAAAGIFQWTPLKHACLTQCRSPQSFFMTEWRDGTRGALLMGLKHGRYCVGCCWLLMGLLFVAGVMNLAWVAVIAVFILAEKVVPAGQWISRAAGLLLIGWGVWMAMGVR